MGGLLNICAQDESSYKKSRRTGIMQGYDKVGEGGS